MRFRNMLMGLACVALAGCSTPPAGPPAEAASPPKAGMAKIIVYYPYSSVWSSWSANVNVAGSVGCRLKSGTFLVRDVKPGTEAVSASLCNGSEGAVLSFAGVADKRYYVQIVPNDQSLLGLIASYGTATTQKETHAESAAFTIDLVEERTALHQLESLRAISR